MAGIKTVVQTVSKTTPVSANYKNCIIQTVPLTDAADTGFEFVVNNNKFYPEQNIQITPVYAGTTGAVLATITSQSKWTFTVKLTNVGTAVLNASCSLNVSVIN
jgi:hypothetical protein